MKRSLAVTLSLLVLAGTSMVWADATSPASNTQKVKHHKRKHQAKPELNPQPLPPRKVPVNGASTGPGGSQPGGPDVSKPQ